MVPSPDVLRLYALLRSYLRGYDLPLRLRLESTLCVLEPAGSVRHGRRHRIVDRTGGIAMAQSDPGSGVVRRPAKRDGPGISGAAVVVERVRPAAARAARVFRNGRAPGDPSRH